MAETQTGLTRREFLTRAAAIAALGGSELRPLTAPTESLRDAAAKRGILYGSALRGTGLKDAAYAELFARQCAIAVPEGALKWGMLRPTPDTYDFSGADWLFEFALKHNLKFRGHTLVWDGDLPPWFNSYFNSRNAVPLTLNHITSVVRHYRDKITSWDVVNEGVLVEDRRPDGLKTTPWLQRIGPNYIDMAFHAAHEADPRAQLVYNENWLEPEDSTTEQKRRAVLRLLTGLKKRGVPIHALGVQSHIFAETYVTGPKFKRFIEEVSDLGLDILITELDVRDQHLPGDVVTRDRLVARQYYNYLSFMLQFRSVKTVLTWGLSNRYTWIAGHNPRRDGQPVRPLPFDAELKPTASWQAIQRAFQGGL